MKQIGNFEVHELTVEEAEYFLQERDEPTTDAERIARNREFRDRLIAASVKYRSGESLLSVKQAPVSQFLSQMGELFDAALDVNGFRGEPEPKEEQVA